MKKVMVLTSIFLVLVFLMLAGSVQAADSDKVYTLKIADSFPTKHPMNKVITFLMEDAKKNSNGRLQFKYYPAQQLGKLKDLLKLCQQGMTDIAYTGTSFFPSQFSLNLVMNLPYYTTAMEGTQIYAKLLATSPEVQAEWAKNKVRVIQIGCTNQYDVGTTKRQINSPEDLKGLRLRVAGALFEVIAKRYGIIPVTMPGNEMYESLQRGILDGTVLTLPSSSGYRLQELIKYHTLGLRMGGFAAGYVISDKSWNKLPPDLQQALLKAGQRTSIYFAKLWDGMVGKLATGWEKKAGMKFTKIPADQRALWDAPLKGIEEEWIAQQEKRGLPGRKVFEQFKKIAEEVVK